MSSILQRNPNPRQKRSISSTIVGFFKKESIIEQDHSSSQECDQEQRQQQQQEEEEEQQQQQQERPLKKQKTDGKSFACDASGLILYESATNERPPVLPILPLQRLRILRYKQQLRRKRYNLLAEQDSDNSVVTLTLHEPVQKKLRIASKLPINKKVRTHQGRSWSGNFEYDLSEYDVVRKDNKIQTHDGIPSLDSPKLSHDILKKDSLPLKGVSKDSGLSETQMKLLSGGTLFDNKNGDKPHLVKIRKVEETELAPQNEKHIAAQPSIGFDFIKKSTTEGKEPGTPSKLIPEKANGKKNLFVNPDTVTSGEKPKEGKAAENLDTGIPSFSFGKTETTANKEGKDALFSSGKASAPLVEKAPGTNPGFSLGGSGSGENKEEPKFSFLSGASTEKENTTNNGSLFGTSKPHEEKPGSGSSFSFGSGISKPEGSSKPGPLFGGKPSKVEPDNGNLKPAFSFGTITSTAEDKKDKSKLPTSSSLAPSDKQDSTKPVFSFGTGTISSGEEKKQQLKPSFAFGTTAGTGASADDNVQKPKFTFDSIPSTENKKQSPKPSFSFGATSGEKKEEKPAFSFGSLSTDKKNDVPVLSTAPDSIKPAPAPAPAPASASAPSFSFGSSVSSSKKENTPKTVSLFGNTNENKPAATASGGFKFDMTGFNSAESSKPAVPSFSFGNPSSKDAPSGLPTVASSKPSFNFGGATASQSLGAPQPQQAASGFNFSAPASQQSNGFGFTSSSTTRNNSPSFGGSVNGNQQQAFNAGFGTNNTASPTPPPFGGSVTPAFPSANGASQSRPFSPSNTVNLNFGNNGASQSPGAIFAGASNSATPSQLFGGQPQNPAQVFGAAAAASTANPAQMFTNGNNGGIASQPQMMSVPPGRKLARMRARRG